jgi:hypothetical protein
MNACAWEAMEPRDRANSQIPRQRDPVRAHRFNGNSLSVCLYQHAGNRAVRSQCVPVITTPYLRTAN